MQEDFMATIGANIREFIASMNQVDSAIRDAATGAQIDITADIVEFERQSRQVANEVRSLERNYVSIPVNIEADNATRQLRAIQYEIRNMQNEMKLANKVAMLPFRINMMETERDMFKLAQSMGSFSGSTRDFMAEIQNLGAQYKSASDAMINADRGIAASMIMTAGAMLNMSTQASKISANYARMANPMYSVNSAGLAVADTMNRIANSGNAAVLSLRMLGPNASMKQLYDMQNMINQGLMRYPMVAMAALASGVAMYGGLHKAAMEANAGYADSFNTMTANLRKAIEPMVQVFATVMGHVWNFINSIAELIIKFNTAHPVLAKFIQGFLMLIPALTLILAPLAVGVGLWNGMLAVWGLAWTTIGPLITGLAAMSATVWIVAAAITALVGGIAYLWKTNEGFRNAVVGAWDAIKSKAVEVFGMLTPLINKVAEGFKTLGSAITSAIQGDFSQLGAIFAQLIPNIIGFLVGGIPGLIIASSKYIPAIAQGIISNAGQLSATIQNVVNTIVNFLTTQAPQFIQQGATMIQNIIQGIATALPLVAQAIVNIINAIIPVIAQMLPVLMQAGIQIIQALIQGIATILPVLVQTFVSLITTLVQTIITALPQLLQAGVQVIMTLINGIVQAIPQLLQLALTLVMQIVNAIVTNLPMLIEAGVQALMALVNGLVQALPQLIDAAVQLITQLADAIVSNLPMIIEAGVNILIALIDGIVSIIPKLIDAAIKLIEAIIKVVTDNLPKIIESGIKILTALIDGIVKILPKLIDCAVDLIIKVVETLINNLPKIIEAGGKILKALVDGIIKLLPQLAKCALDLVVKVAQTVATNLPKIIDAGKKLLEALIKGIVSLVGKLGSAITGDIIPAITKGLKSAVSTLTGIGKDLISGLINGIKSMAASAINAIAGVANGIINKAKSLLKIGSPSKLFKQYGGWVSEGLGIGIVNMASAPIDAIKDISYAMASAFDPQLAVEPLNIGAQMDELKRQIKQELDIDLWVNQEKKINDAQGTGNSGDLILEIDGYELARIQRDHLDDLNGTHAKFKLTQMGYSV